MANGFHPGARTTESSPGPLADRHRDRSRPVPRGTGVTMGCGVKAERDGRLELLRHGADSRGGELGRNGGVPAPRRGAAVRFTRRAPTSEAPPEVPTTRKLNRTALATEKTGIQPRRSIDDRTVVNSSSARKNRHWPQKPLPWPLSGDKSPFCSDRGVGRPLRIPPPSGAGHRGHHDVRDDRSCEFEVVETPGSPAPGSPPTGAGRLDDAGPSRVTSRSRPAP
jgi:hypothetical protein